MKVRYLVVLAAMLGTLVPLAGHAEDRCASPIYLFSTTRVDSGVDDPTNPGHTIGRGLPSLVSSAIGCTVVQDTVLGGYDPTLEPFYNSDYVYPASNRFSVRLLNNGSEPGAIASATLTWAGDTITLDLQPSVDVTGAAADWLDSQSITVDPADTSNPGNLAVVNICLTADAGGDCYSRTYRTVGS